MRGGRLFIALAIWTLPISGHPLPRDDPLAAESQQQQQPQPQPQQYEQELRYRLRVDPELRVTKFGSKHEAHPQNAERVQEVEQPPDTERTQNQSEAEQVRQKQETPPGQEAAHLQEAEQQEQQPQNHHDMALWATSLAGIGTTAAYSVIQTKGLHSRLDAANKRIRELQEKHDKLSQEVSKLDEAAAKRAKAPPPSTDLIECILKDYQLPPNWKELSFLIPSEIWNKEGPRCPGWRVEYAVASGGYKKIDVWGRTKLAHERQQTKKAPVDKGDRGPQVPSTATLNAWMSDAATRLGKLSNKVVGAFKPSPIWRGGFQPRPALIF